MRKADILIAMDSFKGTLGSLAAGLAIRRGLAEGLAELGVEAEMTVVPIADGGEGTVEAFHAAMGGECVSVPCRNPLGNPVDAQLLLLPDKRTAVLEMAASCGLPLVKGRADILRSDTFGLGQQILAALELGVKKILLGIGGSATNDWGAGMARALGARFLDASGHELGTTPLELEQIHHIDLSRLDARLTQVRFEVICDVNIPLLGPSGTAVVYAPQKGATPEIVVRLEAIGRRFADVVESTTGSKLRDLPGTGAAGGLGFGLCTFLRAKLLPGIEVVMETTQLRRRAQASALLITGEGRLDSQSLHGKAPSGVAGTAADLGLPCVAFCGSAAGLDSEWVPKPFAALFQITSVADSLEDAMSRAAEHLQRLARRHAREVYLLCARLKANEQRLDKNICSVSGK